MGKVKKKSLKKPKAGKKEKRYTKDGRLLHDEYGRSTKMTEDCLAKLDHAFSIGASDTEACLYANIDPATMYRYQEKNPKFRERKEQLKETPILQARKVVVDAIKNKDTDTAKWLLERKKKSEFSTRVENTGADGQPILRPLEVTLNVVNPKNKKS